MFPNHPVLTRKVKYRHFYLPEMPLLIIDNGHVEAFMNTEPLYKDENETPLARPASLFLKRLLQVLWAIGWLALLLFVSLFIIAALAMVGLAPLQNLFEFAPSMTLISASIMSISAAVFLIIVKQLRQICQTLLHGDPFVPKNADRLRIIWIAVAVGEILRLCASFFLSWLSKNMGGDVQQTLERTVDIRLYVWFMVLALIILSEVFREGARLRQEQKLTV